MTRREKLERYFERIGLKYEEPYEPNLEHLYQLHQAHNFTIPYENLDILRGKPLSLKDEDLYDKFILNARGGYCFEVNGLLAWLLKELGYQVTEYLARYLRGETLAYPMRRHRVMKVALPEGDFLVDVGIGDKAQRNPLRIQAGLVQEDFGELYKLEKEDVLGWVVYDQLDGAWRPFFSFTEEFQAPTDYEMPSFWCEKNPDSPFNKVPFICLKQPKGMFTIIDDVFRDSTGDTLIEKKLETLEDKKAYFKKYFNLDY